MTNKMQWQPWPENGPGEEYHDYELVVWVEPYAISEKSYIAYYTDTNIGTGWIIDLGNVWRHIHDEGEFELNETYQVTHFAAITPPEDAA